jgi:hypothetical protein
MVATPDNHRRHRIQSNDPDAMRAELDRIERADGKLDLHRDYVPSMEQPRPSDERGRPSAAVISRLVRTRIGG